MELSLPERFDIQKNAVLTANISSCAMRKEMLKQLLKRLTTHADELCKAIQMDFRCRSIHETKMLEFYPVIQSIRYALKHLSDWMKPQPADIPWWMSGAGYVVPEPLGVVGIMVPWNYPITLSFLPLIPALCAGNRVMIKLPELTPHTNAVLDRMISSIFSMQDVQTLSGDTALAEAFAHLPFDHLLFTGSSSTGRKIMRAASDNLTPVTLELGGKSPVLIAPNYPLETAVERLMTGKLFNAGQTCIAPDYVLIRKNAVTLFTMLAQKFVDKHYPHILQNPDYSCVINDHHVRRLETLLDDAAQKGATIYPLATPIQNGLSQKFIPHLVSNVTENMRLSQEEIFGPILPILTYDDFSEAIKYVRHKPKPLALYIFDHNRGRVQDMISRTSAGGITVNDVFLHAGFEDMPFGGVGESGMGQYRGKTGFDTFTHYKSIFYQRRWSTFSFMRPPFRKIANGFIRMMVR
jgi:acyl-CoA reductase-like NAD-dependent aldehyde dehydrogenase